MAVPMRKVSKRRSRQRAAHHSIRPRNVQPCPRCMHVRPAHRVCPNCGYYADRDVLRKED
jgi:large subunit ribosomal protein L32